MECVSKSEVDWTDAEEQVSIGNARALNAIFNGVDLNNESVSEYNERVLEIANESLLLGENIPTSKIVCKVLRSLPGKFDMKDTDDSEEADGGTNAFIVNIIETDSAIEDESGNFEEEGEDNLSLEQLEIK
ncbi:gag-pol polyprotein [Cucumis melo var. makuwa]|uniref:Gag-pol polyprotein n=1 Tax=Cucumis melo var. makuwa TaxID=1194695 RepID=A0A5D3DZL7_CUCMM|nr:gag-pol polyprotein [Cucumis melo var. makuwa]